MPHRDTKIALNQPEMRPKANNANQDFKIKKMNLEILEDEHFDPQVEFEEILRSKNIEGILKIRKELAAELARLQGENTELLSDNLKLFVDAYHFLQEIQEFDAEFEKERSGYSRLLNDLKKVNSQSLGPTMKPLPSENAASIVEASRVSLASSQEQHPDPESFPLMQNENPSVERLERLEFVRDRLLTLYKQRDENNQASAVA